MFINPPSTTDIKGVVFTYCSQSAVSEKLCNFFLGIPSKIIIYVSSHFTFENSSIKVEDTIENCAGVEILTIIGNKLEINTKHYNTSVVKPSFML
jgi:hypothetical protein